MTQGMKKTPYRKPATKREAERVNRLLDTCNVRVPPVSVGLKFYNEVEGGSDSHANGDYALQVNVDRRAGGSIRYELADKLRFLADVVSNVKGDPIDGAVITILFRRTSAEEMLHGRKKP